MSAHAILNITEEKWSEHLGATVSVVARCSECGHAVFTGGRADWDWSGILDDHLAQHAPGRALDIEIQYRLDSDCTVCDDGGDLYDEGEVIECRDCGTTWYSDGTGGERATEGEGK